MEKLAFRGEAKDVAQKQTTLNNLLVLRKETESEATSVWNQGAIVPFILNLINDKAENEELMVTGIRILDETLNNNARAMKFLAMHDLCVV